MANAGRPKYLSIRPSQAEKGGEFGFPVGALVRVIDAEWTTWSEAGEKALVGKRKPTDPALKVTGEISGVDEPRSVFLSAGKGERAEPSRDGEYLQPAENSSAQAFTEGCNAFTFLESLTDKKRQGKMVMDENTLDNGIRKAIIGLLFVAGQVVVKRTNEDNKENTKPTLIAEEIKELPDGSGEWKGGGSKSSSRASSGGRGSRDDDREERPARGRGREENEESSSRGSRGRGRDEDVKDDKGAGGDDDVEALTEKAILEALDTPKYRKGIEPRDIFAAVYNQVKGKPNHKEICAIAEDTKWVEDRARPWKVDRDGVIEAV